MNTRSTSSRRALVAAALSAPLLLTVMVAAPASASARPAIPPPPVPEPLYVQFGTSWQFRVGAQADRAAAAPQYRGDTRVFHRAVPVALDWGLRHGPWPADLAGFDLYRTSPAPARLLHRSQAMSYGTVITDQAYRLPGQPASVARTLHPQFRIVATDVLGRRQTDETRRDPVFYEQENGVTYQNGRTVFPSAPTASRAWSRTTGRDYDGGTVLTSTRRGATVTIPVRSHSYAQHFALEMSTGPRSGMADVLVDGKRIMTVDTYNARPRDRVLVAQFSVSTGDHVVSLVNAGVSRRPVVQLDGIFASD